MAEHGEHHKKLRPKRKCRPPCHRALVIDGQSGSPASPKIWKKVTLHNRGLDDIKMTFFLKLWLSVSMFIQGIVVMVVRKEVLLHHGPRLLPFPPKASICSTNPPHPHTHIKTSMAALHAGKDYALGHGPILLNWPPTIIMSGGI